MADDDQDLRSRLVALEASAPSFERPSVETVRRRGRFALPSTLAAVVFVAAVGTAAGAAIVSEAVRGAPGVENAGQPLAGANLECMSPPEAAAYLTSHGYTGVVWQVEADAPDSTGEKPGTTTDQRSVPPDHGYVVPGSIIDGVLYMVIDQRHDAQGSGACFGRPMP